MKKWGIRRKREKNQEWRGGKYKLEWKKRMKRMKKNNMFTWDVGDENEVKKKIHRHRREEYLWAQYKHNLLDANIACKIHKLSSIYRTYLLNSNCPGWDWKPRSRENNRSGYVEIRPGLLMLSFSLRALLKGRMGWNRGDTQMAQIRPPVSFITRAYQSIRRKWCTRLSVIHLAWPPCYGSCLL